MKSKAWLLTLVASLGAGAVMAQDTNLAAPAASPAAPLGTPAIPAAPAPAAPIVAPAPAEAVPDAGTAKPAPAKPKKKAVKKLPVKSSGLPAAHTLLDPAAPATVKVEALNVRGLPSLSGEVVTKLHKGDTVTIVEEITLDKVREGEPAKWARVTLPTNTPVWVSSHLVDPTTKTVTANRLNVRGGPGENYNVVGRLDKGTVVKEIKQHETWMEIETPTNATGFVSSDFLEKQSTPSTPAPTPIVAANPAPNPVTANPTGVFPGPSAPAPTAPTTAPAPTTAAAPAPAPAEVVNVQPDTSSIVMPPMDATPPAPAETPATAATAPAPAPATAAAAPVTPTPEPAAVTPAPAPENKDTVIQKRIVTREGIVRVARNIQAPSYFELRDAKTGELLDYLHPTKEEIELKSYAGQKVIVSGEEAMDRRWKYTPVIDVETIDQL